MDVLSQVLFGLGELKRSIVEVLVSMSLWDAENLSARIEQIVGRGHLSKE